MNPLPIIWASLRQYRFSAFAFMLLIAAGTSLSVAIISQERALRTGSARAADRFDLVVAAPAAAPMRCSPRSSCNPDPPAFSAPEVTARLLNDPNASFVSPLAFGDSIRGAPVVGVTAPLVQHLSNGLAEGRFF